MAWMALYDPARWNVSDFISYFPRNDGLLALPQTLSKCTYSRAFELDILLSQIFRYLHHWLPYFSGFCSNVTLSWRPSLATLAKNQLQSIPKAQNFTVSNLQWGNKSNFGENISAAHLYYLLNFQSSKMEISVEQDQWGLISTIAFLVYFLGLRLMDSQTLSITLYVNTYPVPGVCQAQC